MWCCYSVLQMSYSTCDFSCVSMNCFHFADVAELGEIGFRGGDFVSAESLQLLAKMLHTGNILQQETKLVHVVVTEGILFLHLEEWRPWSGVCRAMIVSNVMVGITRSKVIFVTAYCCDFYSRTRSGWSKSGDLSRWFVETKGPTVRSRSFGAK